MINYNLNKNNFIFILGIATCYLSYLLLDCLKTSSCSITNLDAKKLKTTAKGDFSDQTSHKNIIIKLLDVIFFYTPSIFIKWIISNFHLLSSFFVFAALFAIFVTYLLGWLSQYIIDALGISDREKLNNHKKQKEISNMKKDDDDVLLGGLNSKNNINEEISKDLLLEKNYEKKNVKRKNILKSINQALK
ncbi:4404_t:CDS:1 [Entrophospora sp. SA101]|nr:4883_t:CDS:1 [Entrophospora sp. SA101]CAJ0747971.1 15876_t:CDS:1 [Entrophospora sp. SA101]CAJ0748015.1 3087_t:CDS:1 [Entrophospora sp. SA101]CAJ0750687.1 7876_t:CDS:1 [Entrophospora sp. SA101]CAJ0756448.1 4404_t:CDS:1 [Entrophospora sp. SA101]